MWCVWCFLDRVVRGCCYVSGKQWQNSSYHQPAGGELQICGGVYLSVSISDCLFGTYYIIYGPWVCRTLAKRKTRLTVESWVFDYFFLHLRLTFKLLAPNLCFVFYQLFFMLVIIFNNQCGYSITHVQYVHV